MRDDLRTCLGEIEEKSRILDDGVFSEMLSEEQVHEFLLDYFARMEEDEIARVFCREVGLDEERVEDYRIWKRLKAAIADRDLENMMEIIQKEPGSEELVLKMHALCFRRKLLGSPEDALEYAKREMGKFLELFPQLVQKYTMAVCLDEKSLKDEEEFWEHTSREIETFYRQSKDILQNAPLRTV